MGIRKRLVDDGKPTLSQIANMEWCEGHRMLDLHYPEPPPLADEREEILKEVHRLRDLGDDCGEKDLEDLHTIIDGIEETIEGLEWDLYEATR